MLKDWYNFLLVLFEYIKAKKGWIRIRLFEVRIGEKTNSSETMTSTTTTNNLVAELHTSIADRN